MMEQLEKRMIRYQKELKELEPSMHIVRLNIKAKIDELQWIMKAVIKSQSNIQLKKIEEEIKSYRWMINEVKRIEDILGIYADKLTAKYGVESSLPKPHSISNPVKSEVLRREKAWKYLSSLEERIKKLDEAGSGLEHPKHRLVFENIKEGYSMKEISERINVSRSRLFDVKKEMLKEVVMIYELGE